jgi:hypothetical protein
MIPDNDEKSLTYVEKEPNVNALRRAYENTLADLEPYFQQCRQSYDDRNNIWPGKTRDLRKARLGCLPMGGRV